ncbi:gamma carbonic anhydrase family protein [Kribbella sandramycini]|uniref:Carbonic anhydrase/acetyltransferase-like protein (Isoleucine patch superfamily) n=1 Tax=Kribbella sandramycini TaxID=60450 RepID=A0A7Y4P266_9ACTN|nr:gamma carbonic anhydrase family protein [Kribbella sandramycini]MBB6566544.1 carbonic anhydrase/acetyltransferase-like protein (isoleucine patch superfamily) [Kribbella sandramycini]NOL42799.1 gamma carbonic anhydrase family protein [Kribbella sandramycini]
MPLFSFEGKSPTVHPDAWIAPTATLVGDVIVEAKASIWYGVVIRADLGTITIRAGANVQDNSVIHSNRDGCEVGPNATVGHQCLVHDCVIGEQALVGNGAIVLDGAVVGSRTLIAAGATVTPGAVIPPESVAMGSPAKKIVPLDGTPKLFVEHNAAIYHELARRHAEGVVQID